MDQVPEMKLLLLLMMMMMMIAYYSRHGSLCWTMLDETKAFDRVNYCKLFWELLDKALPREYLRLLLNIYTNRVT